MGGCIPSVAGSRGVSSTAGAFLKQSGSAVALQRQKCYLAFVAQRKRSTASVPALRRENVETERLNLYVPTDVATGLRVRCAETRRSISDGVTEALRLWLQQEKKTRR